MSGADDAGGLSPFEKLLGDRQRAGTGRALRVLDFPGDRFPGVAVGLWCLMHAETVAARLDAIRHQESLKLTETHLIQLPALADEEIKIQVLARALRYPENPERPFASPQALRAGLEPDEREALFNLYLEWQHERSPLKRVRSAEEVDALVEALGKASDLTTSLSSYDTQSLTRLVRSLVARCSTLTRERSSSSWSASATSTSPSDTTPPG